MNTDISIRPAYLGDLPDQGFADQIGFVRPPRISMLNDRFNPLDENGDPALPPSLQLQVIMLWENDTRIYYPAGEYEPDSATPPSCYSDNKITPSDGAVQPQHETCAGCPRAVRDLPSFNGKTMVSACKERYKLACLVAGAKGKVFLLDIGPASRRAYGQYRNFLKAHHAKPTEVITRLDYADKAFQFSFVEWVDPNVATMVKRIAETDEPAMVVNAYDKPRQTALPAPKAQEWADKVPAAPKDAPMVREAVQHYDDKRTADLARTQFTPSESVVKPPKRRGRPPKDATPPTIDMFPQTQGAGSAGVSTAQTSTIAQTQPSQQQARNNGGGFGMETPQAPPQNIQDALNRAFGP